MSSATLVPTAVSRHAVNHWVGQGWIVPAPNSPLIALRGPTFARDLSLHDFCGELEEAAEVPSPSDETEQA